MLLRSNLRSLTSLLKIIQLSYLVFSGENAFFSSYQREKIKMTHPVYVYVYIYIYTNRFSANA